MYIIGNKRIASLCWFRSFVELFECQVDSFWVYFLKNWHVAVSEPPPASLSHLLDKKTGCSTSGGVVFVLVSIILVRVFVSCVDIRGSKGQCTRD